MHDASIEVAPGVMRRVVRPRAVYRGSADALIAAGLVTADQLPGRKSNQRGLCTFDHLGNRIAGKYQNVRLPGSTRIVRLRDNAETFELWVLLSPARLDAIEAEKLKALEWPFPEMGVTAFMGVQAEAMGVPA